MLYLFAGNLAKASLAVFFLFLVYGNFAMAEVSGIDIIKRSEWKADPAWEKPKDQTDKIPKYDRHLEYVQEEKLIKRLDAKFLTIHHIGRSPVKKHVKTFIKPFQNQMHLYKLSGNSKRKSKWISFLDIPYHYVIDYYGNIAEGRSLDYSAVSNTVYSKDIRKHITITLDGSFSYQQSPTIQQITSLTNLLYKLAIDNDIRLENIIGHSDVANTDCPGKKLYAKIEDIREELRLRGLK